MLLFAPVFVFNAFFCFAFAADQVVLSQNAKLSSESLLWGPYRPNLYFGVRPRIPKSLTTALLWAKVDDFQSAQASKDTVDLQIASL